MVLFLSPLFSQYPALKGIGQGFLLAAKIFMPIWLPVLIIFVGWILFVFISRIIARKIAWGEFRISFEWLKPVAKWLSQDTGWHQTRWGMIAINVIGGIIVSGLIMFIVWLFRK